MNTLNQSCEVKPIPEITRVIEKLERELSEIEESVSLLAEKIKPVLLGNKEQKDCKEERSKCITDLGERLQLDVDKIEILRKIIKELTDRIAL